MVGKTCLIQNQNPQSKIEWARMPSCYPFTLIFRLARERNPVNAYFKFTQFQRPVEPNWAADWIAAPAGEASPINGRSR